MSALIIIMLWFGACIAIQSYLERKESKQKRVKRIEKKVYDFDLSCDDEYSELKKSA